jgi:hypothetical protein
MSESASPPAAAPAAPPAAPTTSPPAAPAEPVAKEVLKKTQAWIFDGTGVARKGWLQVFEGESDARPADKGWHVMAELPGPPDSAVCVFLWADDVDKYIARIDIGFDRRWIIMEGLPALLTTAGSLNALVQMGSAAAPRS